MLSRLIGRHGSCRSALLRITAQIFELAPDVFLLLLTLALSFRQRGRRDNAFLSCLLSGLCEDEARERFVRSEVFCESDHFSVSPFAFIQQACEQDSVWVSL